MKKLVILLVMFSVLLNGCELKKEFLEYWNRPKVLSECEKFEKYVNDELCVKLLKEIKSVNVKKDNRRYKGEYKVVTESGTKVYLDYYYDYDDDYEGSKIQIYNLNEIDIQIYFNFRDNDLDDAGILTPDGKLFLFGGAGYSLRYFRVYTERVAGLGEKTLTFNHKTYVLDKEYSNWDFEAMHTSAMFDKEFAGSFLYYLKLQFGIR